jgi:apolipoprotein N-acyltransferase
MRSQLFLSQTLWFLKPAASPTHWSWRRAGFVGLSGLVMAAALPPLSLWPLAWVALVPLWWVVQSTVVAPWPLAAAYGLLWGLAYYGSSLVWITHLHPLMWLGIPWAGSIAIALFAWIFITLWGSVCIAVWAVGLRWLSRRRPAATTLQVLGATALWCLLETLRNYTPLDWSPLGLTQSPNNLWILHLTRLTGPMAITALIVAINGLLATVFPARADTLPTRADTQVRHPPIHPSTHPPIHPSTPPLPLILLLLAHLLGAALYFWPAAEPPEQALTLGMVQGNVPTREKLTAAGIAQAFDDYSRGYRELAAQGVEAVVTPEGAIPLLWNPNAPQFAALARVVEQTGVPLWLGTAAPADRPGEYTQSLLELYPTPTEGVKPQARYDKVQLVPLGEYIPFEPVLGQVINRLSPLDSYLVPGAAQQTFETSLGQGIVGICYESAYGRFFWRQARAGGSFVITASNNDPYPPGMMKQHHGFDVLRAVESDRWAIRVTNTGLSGLVDGHGRTRWLAPVQVYATHKATLYRHPWRTPYITWGDWLTPLLVGLTGLRLMRRPH